MILNSAFLIKTNKDINLHESLNACFMFKPEVKLVRLCCDLLLIEFKRFITEWFGASDRLEQSYNIEQMLDPN